MTEKDILDLLLERCFYVIEDYSNWDSWEEPTPKLMVSWMFNECYSLKNNDRDIHDILFDYIKNHPTLKLKFEGK